MHVAHIPTDGATVVAKQIHDHEVEAYADKYDVHQVNEDGSTTHVGGPTFAGVIPPSEQHVADAIEAANAELAKPAPSAKKAAKKK